MILSKTNQYALFSLLFFVASVGVSGFTYHLIDKEGSKLETQMRIVGENKLLQEQYNSLLIAVDESKFEYEELNSYMLTEDKTINFLSEIETLASDMGLQFSTDSLEVVPLPNPQFKSINLALKATGKRDDMVGFLTILETLPYYSRIDDLTFSEVSKGGATWTSKISLMVGLHTYDK